MRARGSPRPVATRPAPGGVPSRPLGQGLVVEPDGVGEPTGCDEQPRGVVLVGSLEPGGTGTDRVDVAVGERLDDGRATRRFLGESPRTRAGVAVDAERVPVEGRRAEAVGGRR